MTNHLHTGRFKRSVRHEDPRPLRRAPRPSARRDVLARASLRKEEDKPTEADVLALPAQARARGRDAGGLRQREAIVDKLDAFKPDVVFNLCETFLSRPRARAEHPGAARAHEGALHRRRARRADALQGQGAREEAARLSTACASRASSCRRASGRCGGSRRFIYPGVRQARRRGVERRHRQASFARDEEEALERARFLHERFESDALIEEYIDGRELYLGVLGNKRLTVFPPREIFFGEAADDDAPQVRHAKAKWDDAYRKKWGIRNGPAGAAARRRRARSSRELARKVYRILKIRGLGRIDVRLTPARRGRRHRGQPEPVAGAGGRLRAGGRAGGHRLRRAHPEDPGPRRLIISRERAETRGGGAAVI